METWGGMGLEQLCIAETPLWSSHLSQGVGGFTVPGVFRERLDTLVPLSD